MSLKVACMQPTFLPWAGYFGLLASADLFVFLDDFQYCRRSFHQRNRMFVAPGHVDWITVPVEHAPRTARLDEVRPQLVGARFADKLLATFRHAYHRAPGYAEMLPVLERWLGEPHPSMAAMNMAMITTLARRLGIETRLARSSELGSAGRRSSRILSILERTAATTYLSARGSAEYMVDDAIFPIEGIDVGFQAYEPEPYPQVGAAAFVPYLSIVDVIAQCGFARAAERVRAGNRPFTPWSEMKAHFAPDAAAGAGDGAADAPIGGAEDAEKSFTNGASEEASESVSKKVMTAAESSR